MNIFTLNLFDFARSRTSQQNLRHQYSFTSNTRDNILYHSNKSQSIFSNKILFPIKNPFNFPTKRTHDFLSAAYGIRSFRAALLINIERRSINFSFSSHTLTLSTLSQIIHNSCARMYYSWHHMAFFSSITAEVVHAPNRTSSWRIAIMCIVDKSACLWPYFALNGQRKVSLLPCMVWWVCAERLAQLKASESWSTKLSRSFGSDRNWLKGTCEFCRQWTWKWRSSGARLEVSRSYGFVFSECVWMVVLLDSHMLGLIRFHCSCM